MNWPRIAFGLLVLFGATIGQTRARELADMSGEEIKVLQQRLTDAGCYKGAIDGTPSEALQAAKKACPDQEPALHCGRRAGDHAGPHLRRV